MNPTVAPSPEVALLVSKTVLYVAGSIIMLLLAVVGFFLRSLVIKLEEANKKLISIDKQMAVMASEMKRNEIDAEKQSKTIDRHENEILKLRNRYDSLIEAG